MTREEALKAISERLAVGVRILERLYVGGLTYKIEAGAFWLSGFNGTERFFGEIEPEKCFFVTGVGQGEKGGETNDCARG